MLLGFYFLEGYMIRTYKPKSKCKFRIMVCRGCVPTHIDEMSKTCVLIPIKIHKKNTFIEDRSVCLQPGLIYTFNDYNRHELVIPNCKSISYLIVIDFVK